MNDDRGRRGPAGSTARRLVGAVVVLLTAWGLAALPAAARTDLEVTTPADGRYQPGQPVPLIVTLTADRATSGTLTVDFDGFPGGSTEVELTGGSTKRVILVASSPPWSGGGARVVFDADDEADDATARLGLTSAGQDELVGVLGRLAERELPATAELAVPVGVARLYPVDEALLAEGPDGLAVFSQLITTTDDLAAVGADRAAVDAWVRGRGGVLVLDDEIGRSPFDDLPAPDPGVARVAAGLGEVRWIEGAASAGSYDGRLAPTATRSTEEFPWGGFGSFPAAMQLARDAGVRIPAVGSLLAGLALYTVVVGPVLWFALRRFRREPLLWLGVPVVAVLATVGVYGVGQALRSDTSTAHATLRVDLPSYATTSTQVLVTAPSGGRAGIRLPEGWREASRPPDEVWFEGPFGSSAGNLVGDGRVDGDELVVELPPGGASVLYAVGEEVTDGPGSWSFDLRPDGDDLVGTVTNLTGVDLSDVMVSSGRGLERVGDVGAGETVEVSLRDAASPVLFDDDPLMQQVWQFDPWNPREGEAFSPGVLGEWLGRNPAVRRPGLAIAVGWARDRDGPLSTISGTPVDRGRSGFLSVAPVDLGAGAPVFLRGWSTQVDDPVGGQCADTTMTVRLAAGDLDPAGAVLDVQRRAIAALDVWDGDDWVPAGMADRPADVVLGLPASAVADGAVYVRFSFSCEVWGMRDPVPRLRAAEAGDEPVELAAVGEDLG